MADLFQLGASMSSFNPLSALASGVGQLASGAFQGAGIAKAGKAIGQGLTNQGMAGYLGDRALAQADIQGSQNTALGEMLSSQPTVPVGIQIMNPSYAGAVPQMSPFTPSQGPAPTQAPIMPGYQNSQLVAMGMPPQRPGAPPGMPLPGGGYTGQASDASGPAAPIPSNQPQMDNSTPTNPMPSFAFNEGAPTGFNAMGAVGDYGALTPEVQAAYSYAKPYVQAQAQQVSGNSPYEQVTEDANAQYKDNANHPYAYAAGALAHNFFGSGQRKALQPEAERERQIRHGQALNKGAQAEYDKAGAAVMLYANELAGRGIQLANAQRAAAEKFLPPAEIQRNVFNSIFLQTKANTPERAALIRQVAESGLLPMGNSPDKIAATAQMWYGSEIVTPNMQAEAAANTEKAINAAAIEKLKAAELPKYYAAMEQYRKLRDDRTKLAMKIAQEQLDYRTKSDPAKLRYLQEEMKHLGIMDSIAIPRFESEMMGREAYVLGVTQNIQEPRSGGPADPGLLAQAMNITQQLLALKTNGLAPSNVVSITPKDLVQVSSAALDLLQGKNGRKPLTPEGALAQVNGYLQSIHMAGNLTMEGLKSINPELAKFMKNRARLQQ